MTAISSMIGVIGVTTIRDVQLGHHKYLDSDTNHSAFQWQ